MAIGLGFQFTFALGIVVAAAVVSHDFCDGLVTVTLMLSSDNSVKKSLGLLVVNGTAPIVGAVLAVLVVLPDNYLVISLSFLTGGFIYLGTMHLLHRSFRESPRWPTIFSFASGILVIFFLARILNGIT